LRLFLTALLMQYVGNIGIEAAVILVGIVTIVYTYLGGMKAVLWTDLIQFIIKVGGAALACIFILKALPDGWEQLVSVGKSANKFDLFDFQHVFASAHSLNFWSGLIGGAVFSMASHGADQLMVQRYLCARSLSQARLALILSGFTVTVQFALFLLVGVGLWVLHQQGLFPFPVKPDGSQWLKDEIFGLYIVTQLPQGIVGILVAAVLAAAMSTLSSSLNSSANALVTDFYKPLNPNRDEKHYVRLSRILTAVWGVAQMGVAIAAYRIGGNKSIVEQVLKVAGLTTGLLLGLFILGSMSKPISPRAALIGLIAGAIVVCTAWMPEVMPKESAWKSYQIAWPWYALIGSGTTTLIGLIVNQFVRNDFANKNHA
jgi:solute:Na+ symporter, SSS family